MKRYSIITLDKNIGNIDSDDLNYVLEMVKTLNQHSPTFYIDRRILDVFKWVEDGEVLEIDRKALEITNNKRYFIINDELYSVKVNNRYSTYSKVEKNSDGRYSIDYLRLTLDKLKSNTKPYEWNIIAGPTGGKKK